MLNNKTVLAIIPARGGSKGVPGKNLRVIQGKTLLAHTVESARSSQLIDRVIVSTDDEKILAEAKRANADTPFIRPKELALDHTPSVDVIIHAINAIPNQYDYFILLQVTSPLRDVNDINQSLQLCDNVNAPACVSVTEAEESPYWMFNLNAKKSTLSPLLAKPIPTQRQACPITYVLNGAIFLANTKWFLQTKTFISNETIGYVMPKDRSIDIDTELDFDLLNCYLKRKASIC